MVCFMALATISVPNFGFKRLLWLIAQIFFFDLVDLNVSTKSHLIIATRGCR